MTGEWEPEYVVYVEEDEMKLNQNLKIKRERVLRIFILRYKQAIMRVCIMYEEYL